MIVMMELFCFQILVSRIVSMQVKVQVLIMFFYQVGLVDYATSVWDPVVMYSGKATHHRTCTVAAMESLNNNVIDVEFKCLAGAEKHSR